MVWTHCRARYEGDKIRGSIEETWWSRVNEWPEEFGGSREVVVEEVEDAVVWRGRNRRHENGRMVEQ